jgi:hypothetical protein
MTHVSPEELANPKHTSNVAMLLDVQVQLLLFLIKETSSGLNGAQHRLQPRYKTDRHSGRKNTNSP